jgi:hypothetical protein
MNIMRGASQPCVSRRRERVGLDPTIALMLGEGKPLAKGIEDSTTYRVLVGRRSWRVQAASALALVRKEAVDTHCRREDDCRRRNIIGIIWMELEPVDQCEVLVLVDNVSDLLSTVPRFVTDEVSNIVRSGATEENGSCFCCAQWGLSLVITARATWPARCCSTPVLRGTASSATVSDCAYGSPTLERPSSRTAIGIMSAGWRPHSG